MHSRIGPSGAVNRQTFPTDALKSAFQLVLNRVAVLSGFASQRMRCRRRQTMSLSRADIIRGRLFRSRRSCR